MISSLPCVSSAIRLLTWPFRRVRDAGEFRRLRRRMRSAHRLWVAVDHRTRPENNAEYLVRLRGLARERARAE
jgi:hypothetical protein